MDVEVEVEVVAVGADFLGMMELKKEEMREEEAVEEEAGGGITDLLATGAGPASSSRPLLKIKH